MEVLNPDLFHRLRLRYGSVQVANQGLALSGTLIQHPYEANRLNINDFGESYCVSCPFCLERGDPDRQHRLWVNHLWGVGHAAQPHNKLWNLAVCFHNRCTRIPGTINRLRQMVYGLQSDVSPVRMIGESRPSLSEVSNPGTCVRLDALNDSHHARRYLRDRGFDPDFLAERHGVAYCAACEEYPRAVDRIIAPIIMRGTQVGWQGRYIGNTDWHFTPKYYTLPGMPKQSILYGYDDAVTMPFVVLTEGVTDVWAVGPGTVATFGASLSSTQMELLTQWDVIVVVWDPDKQEDALAAKKRLAAVKPVVLVTLPDGEDPATIPPELFWQRVLDAAEQQNVLLPETGSN